MTTLVAVVLAAQPVQVVHSALVLQGPWVQPVHVESGQPAEPHQRVQGPLCHAPEEVHGPQGALFGPKGQPPAQGPAPDVGHGPVVHVVQSELLAQEAQGTALLVVQGQAAPPEVAEKVASGVAVMGVPALAQSCAITW